MLLALALTTATLALILLLAPFFVGTGGQLAASSAVQNAETLQVLREAILTRYLDDESAFAQQLISASAWQRRQTFLNNRYIDTVRRLDFLTGTQLHVKEGAR